MGAHGVVAGYHAVRIIGWGQDGGDRFWLVANSWGEQWGEGGFFKIARGSNECQNRPSAPYRERKKSEKIKKKAFSGCGTGLYSVGLRALSSCGSTFLSCFAGRSHLLHCPPGTRFSPERGLCTWPASVSGCRL